MHVGLVSETGELAGLGAAWNKLYATDPDAQYFLSWTWMSTWLQRTPSQWLVLVVRPQSGREPVALFPVQIVAVANAEGGFFNVLRMGGHYLSGYTGVLCDPAWQDKALPALAEAVQRLNWAVFQMTGARMAPDRLALFLGAMSPADLTVQSAPQISQHGVNDSAYPRISLPDSMETYLVRAMGAATRKNARAALRKIDSGEYRVTHAHAATLERDLDILMNFWSAKWVSEKGEEDTRVQADDHRAMLHAAHCAGDGLVAILWHGERPIAGQGSLIDRANNTLICLVGSRDLAVRKPAPGFQLHLHCIRWAIEQGFDCYDMLRGGEAYKYDMGAVDLVLDRHRIATRSLRNLRGKLEPRTLPTVFARAQAMVEAGQAVFAAMACQQILQAEPGYPGIGALLKLAATAAPASDPALALARRHLSHDRLGQAERLLRFAARLYERDGDVRHLLGFALFRQGRHTEARQHLQVAASRSAGKPDVHNTLGACLLAVGETRQALSAFDRALALDPGFRAAQENRRRALTGLGPGADVAKARSLA